MPKKLLITLCCVTTICLSYALPTFSHVAGWQKLRLAADEEEIRHRYPLAEALYLKGLELSEKQKWPAVDTTELLARYTALKLVFGVSEQSDVLAKRMLAAKQQIRNPDIRDMDDTLVAIHDVIAKYKLLLGSDDKTWCLYRVVEILDSAFQGNHRDLAWYCYELSGCYTGLGKLKDATTLLNRAEAYNRKMPSFTKLEEYRFHLNAARLYVEINEFKKAIEHADEAIPLAPFAKPPNDTASPRILRAIALQELKQHEAAKKEFIASEPLLEKVAKSALPAWEPYRLTYLGLIRKGQKKYSEADALFAKSVVSFKQYSSSTQYPDCNYALRKRVEVLKLLGKNAEAKRVQEIADKAAARALAFLK